MNKPSVAKNRERRPASAGHPSRAGLLVLSGGARIVAGSGLRLSALILIGGRVSTLWCTTLILLAVHAASAALIGAVVLAGHTILARHAVVLLFLRRLLRARLILIITTLTAPAQSDTQCHYRRDCGGLHRFVVTHNTPP